MFHLILEFRVGALSLLVMSVFSFLDNVIGKWASLMNGKMGSLNRPRIYLLNVTILQNHS